MTVEVLIDGVVFENSYQIGIWRVFYEVIRRTCSDIRYTILLCKEPKQPLPDGITIAKCSHRLHASGLKQRFASARRNRAIRLISARWPNAIWHSTFFTLDPRPSGYSVVTVHDMIAEEFFWTHPQLNSQAQTKATAIDNADGVIVVSEATRAALANRIPHHLPPTFVIPHGHEHLVPALGSPAETPPNRREPYALFVGSRTLYKNFQLVLEAMKTSEWPDTMKLVVAGPPFSISEEQLLRGFGISSNVTHAGRVADEELRNLYKGASCFLFPSKQEGFGLPVLEAQLSGCIPILSDIPVFHETAGEGAIFFDPTSPLSLARSVQRARDNQVHSRLMPAINSNPHRYSWDETANATLKVYKSVAEKSLRRKRQS